MNFSPKTIKEAIILGLEQAKLNDTVSVEACIELHVRDFLAQRFSLMTVNEDENVSNGACSLWCSLKFTDVSVGVPKKENNGSGQAA